MLLEQPSKVIRFLATLIATIFGQFEARILGLWAGVGSWCK